MEAAVAWGYSSMTAWESECPIQRGKVISWYLEKGIRDGYETEKQRAKAEKEADGKKGKKNGNAPYTAHSSFRYGRELLAARAARARNAQ